MEIRLFVPVNEKTQSKEAGVLGEGVYSNRADIHGHNLALSERHMYLCRRDLISDSLLYFEPQVLIAKKLQLPQMKISIIYLFIFSRELNRKLHLSCRSCC